MNAKRALYLIQEERQRQVDKWGDIHHSPIEYIALLCEELGEASRHAHQMHWNGKYYEVNYTEEKEKLKDELTQVAALCVAALESL